MNSAIGYSEGAEVPEDKTYNHSEWISVKDRLPSDSMLCFLSGIDQMFEGEVVYFRTVGSLTEGTDAQNNKISYWIDWAHESMIEDVTHWMPLPEPPTQL